MARLVPSYCSWKSVASSTSYEAKRYREAHAEINFRFCKNDCDGRDTNCEHYKINTLIQVVSKVPERIPIDDDLNWIDNLRTMEGVYD